MKTFFAQQGSSSRVDREARRINGLSIAQKGSANGETFDDETLRRLMTLGNSGTIRARFDHPNRANPSEVDQTLSNLLGQYKNFRIHGDTLRADCYFAG